MGSCRYLQTSPEFFLKRFLAASHVDVYSLGKVFRQGEMSRKHQPEFTLLEWYRVGWDEHQLMGELVKLIQIIIPEVVVQKFSYRRLFIEHLDIDPHIVHLHKLETVGSNFITIANTDNKLKVDDWLDLLMTHYLEPRLPNGLVLIYDYPRSKAALATFGKNHKGQVVARRFEAYLNGMELANGYYELTDAQEQRRRFEKDLEYRNKHRLPKPPYDKRLLTAMKAGLPICSGVALGVDRLLMVMCGIQTIKEVIAFAND
jgi:lysyl-tRNA synthetase class 2